MGDQVFIHCHCDSCVFKFKIKSDFKVHIKTNCAHLLVAERLYIWSCLFVCLSVRPSVCLSFCPRFLSQISLNEALRLLLDSGLLFRLCFNVNPKIKFNFEFGNTQRTLKILWKPMVVMLTVYLARS